MFWLFLGLAVVCFSALAAMYVQDRREKREKRERDEALVRRVNNARRDAWGKGERMRGPDYWRRNGLL